MMRFSPSRAWLLGPFLLLLPTSCVDDESTLFIKSVLHAKQPTCVLQADPTMESLGAGVLDTALTNQYYATFLVGNQFTPRGDKNQNRTETTWVTLRGAEITLSSGASFSVAGSGSVGPNSGTDPGWGLFGAVVIPGPLPVGAGTKLLEIDVHVKVFGVTTGGSDIKSGEFVYPVHLCSGCLIDRPLKALDPTTKACTVVGDDTPTPPCLPGQDDLIDCRLCSGIPACIGP